MGFYEQPVQFNGRRVANYDPETGIKDSSLAYRFATSYDDEIDVAEHVAQFLKDPNVQKVDTLVFGLITIEGDVPPSQIIQLLTENKQQLPNLSAVFFNDVVQEECEVSWLENDDHSAMWQAFPKLEVYRVRGGNGLTFNQPHHAQLKKLIIETGGMSNDTINNIAEANLPELEHLELWLGTEEYGFEATAKDVLEAVQGTDGKHFPKLRYLGLRNSAIADDLATALEGAPILERIEVLDLSMGNLSDKGAEALIDNPAIKNLSRLILDHHYMSDETIEQFRDLGITVSADDAQEADDYGDGEIYRYIAVSE